MSVSIPLRGIAVFQRQRAAAEPRPDRAFPFRCAELLCFNFCDTEP